MNCPQCKNDMVLTQATNFGDQYHYCRSCKKELSEMRSVEPITIHCGLDLSKVDLVPGEIKIYDGTGYVTKMSEQQETDRMSTDCDWIFNWQTNLHFEKEMDKIRAEIERQMIMPKGYFLMGEWE